MIGNFDAALAFTWSPGREGPDDKGSVVHGDTGGFTRLGVTIGTYRAWATAHQQPVPGTYDLANAQVSSLKAIYWSWFWQAVNGEGLPKGLDLLVFDFGVTAGPGRGAKILQGLVGTKADGIIGQQTLEAVKGKDLSGLLNDFTDEVLKYDKTCGGYSLFGKGWDKRRNDALAAGLGWTMGSGLVESSPLVG